MGRKAHWKDASEKQSAYRSRIKDKAEKLRLLKLSFDDYLDEQLSIEDSKRQDRSKCIWDAEIAYSEKQIKINYLKAINHEPLDFGMSYARFVYLSSKNAWICIGDNCNIVNFRFEEKCIGCGSKNHHA